MDLEIANQIGPIQGYSPYALSATATAGVVYTAASAIELSTLGAITPPPSVTIPPTPTAAPTLTPIPSPAATGTARQQSFFDTLKQATGLTRDDYRRIEAEPTVVARKLDQKLRESLPKIGDPYPQLRYSLLAFKDEPSAQAAIKELQALKQADLPAGFIKMAREESLEKFTGVRNGDAGWVVEPMLDPDLFKALNGLAIGQISPAIQRADGWIVVMLTGKDDKRPLDAIEYEYLAGLSYGRSVFFDGWMQAKITAANVTFFV
jgi:hypothetical protein